MLDWANQVAVMLFRSDGLRWFRGPCVPARSIVRSKDERRERGRRAQIYTPCCEAGTTVVGRISYDRAMLLCPLPSRTLVFSRAPPRTSQICRNYFGAQKSSFEVPLDTSVLELDSGDKKNGETTAAAAATNTAYPAVFIRAPAVLEASFRRRFSWEGVVFCGFPARQDEGGWRASEYLARLRGCVCTRC